MIDDPIIELTDDIGLGIGAAAVSALVLLGLPPELRALAQPPAQESALYELAPRIAMAMTLVFLAISALALTRVRESRRED